MINTLLHLFEARFLQSVCSFIVAFVVAINSIPVIINISRLKGLMVMPGGRGSHEVKTPTLGGVAIFASTLLGYLIWENPEDSRLIHLTIAGVIILFFLGIKDDILILSPSKKMIVQVASSALVIIGADLRIDNFFGILNIYEIPYIISFILTIFIFIALINAINLIDGIDGLAGGIGMIASITFGLWFYINKNYALACMAASLAGGLLGFLRFNFSKTSKIFMGDTGSLIMGFLLTVFAIRFVQLNVTYRFDTNTYFSAPILAIVVLIVPIFDTIRVFSLRILAKQSPFVGDRNHVHHLLIDNGLSHFQASFFLCFVSVVSTVLFLWLDEYITNTISLAMLVVMLIIYWIVASLLKQRITKMAQKPLLKSFKKSSSIPEDISTLN